MRKSRYQEIALFMGRRHHFVHGEDYDTTYPTTISPQPLNQEGFIIIEGGSGEIQRVECCGQLEIGGRG